MSPAFPGFHGRPDDAPARQLAALREAFDQAFAAPPPEAATAEDFLIALRLAETPFALRVAELAGFHPLPWCAPLPAAEPALLGLAGLRGRLVPIYDLSALLGLGAMPREGGWVALVGQDEPLGFAFAEFEGPRRVPSDRIRPLPEPRAPWLPETVQTGAEARGLIRLAALAAELWRRAGHAAPDKET
jgi:purine-binding chemotaxis protein CheW